VVSAFDARACGGYPLRLVLRAEEGAVGADQGFETIDSFTDRSLVEDPYPCLEHRGLRSLHLEFRPVDAPR